MCSRNKTSLRPWEMRLDIQSSRNSIWTAVSHSDHFKKIIINKNKQIKSFSYRNVSRNSQSSSHIRASEKSIDVGEVVAQRRDWTGLLKKEEKKRGKEKKRKQKEKGGSRNFAHASRTAWAASPVDMPNKAYDCDGQQCSGAFLNTMRPSVAGIIKRCSRPSSSPILSCMKKRKILEKNHLPVVNVHWRVKLLEFNEILTKNTNETKYKKTKELNGRETNKENNKQKKKNK